MRAVAYLNVGRWVADCPVEGCGDALALYPEVGADAQRRPVLSDVPIYTQTDTQGHRFDFDAPPDDARAGIEAAVADRPEPNRNWLPDGHPWGALYGCPTGQSVKELLDETAHERAKHVTEQVDAAATITEALAALGVEVLPDGSFSGKIPGME